MRRSSLVVVLAMLMVVVMAGTASAGEITGTGKSTPIRDHVAASICSFSGLDDADDDGFGRTQSWGQLSKADRAFLTAIGFSPGKACNPNTEFSE